MNWNEWDSDDMKRVTSYSNGIASWYSFVQLWHLHGPFVIQPPSTMRSIVLRRVNERVRKPWIHFVRKTFNKNKIYACRLRLNGCEIGTNCPSVVSYMWHTKATTVARSRISHSKDTFNAIIIPCTSHAHTHAINVVNCNFRRIKLMTTTCTNVQMMLVRFGNDC